MTTQDQVGILTQTNKPASKTNTWRKEEREREREGEREIGQSDQSSVTMT